MGKEVTISDVRAMTHAELDARAIELRKELFVCRSAGVGSGEKKMNSKKRNCRKELARILTVAREKELNEIPTEPLL